MTFGRLAAAGGAGTVGRFNLRKAAMIRPLTAALCAVLFAGCASTGDTAPAPQSAAGTGGDAYAGWVALSRDDEAMLALCSLLGVEVRPGSDPF